MNQRGTRGVAALIVLGLTLGALAACTGGGSPGVATAATRPAAYPSASPKATGPQDQELAFVACMRSHGVANMPDPTPGDTSGRSAVKAALDVLGLGDDQTFQAALDSCQSLLPPPPAPSPLDNGQLTQELQFAQCMRDHGVTGFTDPNPDGSWKALWISDADPVAKAAAAACDHILAASPGASG